MKNTIADCYLQIFGVVIVDLLRWLFDDKAAVSREYFIEGLVLALIDYGIILDFDFAFFSKQRLSFLLESLLEFANLFILKKANTLLRAKSSTRRISLHK